MIIFVTYVSPPRMPLGAFGETGAQPKTVAVSGEDILLTGIVLVWLARPSFVRWRSPLKGLILAYLAWSIISTLIAISQGWVRPLRAMFYTGKEIEYFLFFLVGLLCVRNLEDVKGGIAGLVAGALVQGAYAVYQLATGAHRGAYGVGLLWEINPHIAGLCGTLSVWLGVALFSPTSPRLAVLSGLCAALGAASIIASISRTALVAWVAAGFVLLLLELPQRRGVLGRWAPIGLIGVAVAAAGLAYTFLLSDEREATLFTRRMGPMLGAEASLDASIQEYHQTRIDYVYAPYWELIPQSPILGNGKSITGTSEERFAETHNYYLRLLVETGFVGLILYLALMMLVLRTAYRLYRMGHPPLVRRMGLLCLLYSITLLIAALAQDIFIVPRLAELFWVLVGMATGLERLRLFRQPTFRPALL